MLEIKRNLEKNGIEIYFGAEPDEEVKSWLKSRRFRYSGAKKVWYNFFTENSWNEANEHFLGKKPDNPIKKPDMETITIDKYTLTVPQAFFLWASKAQHAAGKKKSIIKHFKGIATSSELKAELIKKGLIGKVGHKTKETTRVADLLADKIGFDRLGIDPAELLEKLKKHAAPPKPDRSEGLTDIHPDIPVADLRAELEAGVNEEMEHTTDRSIASQIAYDHLKEDPKYYTKLKAAGLVEKTEPLKPVKTVSYPPEPEYTMKEFTESIIIERSEGLSETNIPVADLNELQGKLIEAGMTENPEETYIKNKVLFDGKAHRIDSGKMKNDFDYSKEHIRDYLKRAYPHFDWAKYDEPQIKSDYSEEILGATYDNSFTLNKAIEKLLDDKWNDEIHTWTPEEIEFISRYSGYGGLDEFGEITRGSLFEYYTPDLVIEKMWGLARANGYNDGSVLEPSIGVGAFFNRQYVSEKVYKVGYETNKYSARISQLIYPEAIINPKKIGTGTQETMYFEEAFIKNNYTVRGKVDPSYSLVIGNPPYGSAQGKFMAMGEKNYTHAKNYIDYFITRGLDLLLPGGLLIYIIGAEVAGGAVPWLEQGTSKTKEAIEAKADLIVAYRLPNGVFERTDVVSDIVVLKKKL